MDKRRTIAFKLNPDVNQTDKIVCDTLDSIPQGERSRLNRAALTAGLALYSKIGAPFLLCELLTKETTFSDIVNILRSLFPKEMADFNSSTITQPSSQQGQRSDEETKKKNAMKLIN
ncbi:plasmid partitioning/stability family protein [Escherichia coli]|uniref:plasmid partitioning/stability family protein n=1 Tax=Escherichia coli TaxID=562 RepID=UPI003890BB70